MSDPALQTTGVFGANDGAENSWNEWRMEVSDWQMCILL